MKDKLTETIPSLPTFKFKRDDYMRHRGAPVMLYLTCAYCQHYVMSYQKDGPGPLLRCYLDRIHHPAPLAERQHMPFDKKTFPKLSCPACDSMIGHPVTYVKEKRPAYHMIKGSFCKSVLPTNRSSVG
ncbi:MAG: hypothetical protein AAF335_01980 [Bacteroidota bacterium]